MENPSQRNAKAVSRLFARQGQQPGQSHRRAASDGSARACRQATAAEVVGRTLTSSVQPAWVNVRRRELLRDPSHDIPSHLGQQLELAAAMNTISSEARAEVLAHATSTDAAQARQAVGPAGQSCFGLQLERARHARARQPPQSTTAHELFDTAQQQRAAYHRQQAILRYEQTLPRRRAVDPYLHLTAAQQSTSMRIPNRYTAQKMADRDGGRFVLDNPYRQQLRDGTPSMTRIMRGDYYYPTASSNEAGGAIGSGLSHGSGAPGHLGGANSRGKHAGRSRSVGSVARTDFVAANKRHVHVASLINSDAHRQARFGGRSRSAKPYLACRCEA